MGNQEIVDCSLQLLAQNPEWIERFAGYARKISSRMAEYQRKRCDFRAKLPFSSYTTISKAKGTFEYDLRFKGQSLGIVKVEDERIIFVPGKNYKYFEKFGQTFVDIEKKGEEWNTSKNVKKYRSIINQNKSILIPKSPEHECENKLLYEFKKKKSACKSLLGIQPICIGGNFFQMPTPFKASNHKEGVLYSGKGGGGIDILARIGKKRICVMEVKDGYENDSQMDAIHQALSYATFLACLLRSKSGQVWWKIFGYSSTLPAKIDIDVVSVMPIEGIDNHQNEDIPLSNGCVLHTRSLYFDKEQLLQRDNQRTDIFQFTGTFINKS